MRLRKKTPGNGNLLEGYYANYFEIGHNAFEFLLDFGQLYVGETEDEGQMHTRIVTCPEYARRLAEVLNQTLSEYHQIYGYWSEGYDEPDGTKKAKIRRLLKLKKS